MRRATGWALLGKSKEEPERRASEDERMARAGLVRLKSSDGRTWHKPLEELRPEDRRDRIRAERETTAWLRGRIEAEKIAKAWRENARDLPDA